MNKIRFAILFEIILIFCLLFFAFSAKAAIFYFEPSAQDFNATQEFKLDIFLNAENAAINAIEGEIVFPSDLLELQSVYDGGSIINLWLEKPQIEKEKIIFSGIITAGFSGEKGKIFSIIFKTKNAPIEKETSGVIKINDLKILLNDGKGTEIQPLISNFKFKITSGAPLLKFLMADDKNPPESFKPEIVLLPQIAEDKYFLIFAAEDRETGIDYYQIKEGGRLFINAESPYLLKNQALYDKIIVRAVDKAGNSREVIIAPSKMHPAYYLIPIIFIIFLAVYFMRRKLRK